MDCPPLPEPAWVDRDMWEKIVLNLLSNAFKFTFEGAIAVTLQLRGERIELVVADTGTGIPEHELPAPAEQPIETACHVCPLFKYEQPRRIFDAAAG